MPQYSPLRISLVKINGDVILLFIYLRHDVMVLNADIQNILSNKSRLRRNIYSCKINFAGYKTYMITILKYKQHLCSGRKLKEGSASRPSVTVSYLRPIRTFL